MAAQWEARKVLTQSRKIGNMNYEYVNSIHYDQLHSTTPTSQQMPSRCCCRFWCSTLFTALIVFNCVFLKILLPLPSMACDLWFELLSFSLVIEELPSGFCFLTQ